MPDDTTAARLDITASDKHVYEVAITHPTGADTRHCVTVPESLMARLGLSAAQEPLLVRAALAYLLEHSPAAIPDRFDLDEIAKAVPEFDEEIPARI